MVPTEHPDPKITLEPLIKSALTSFYDPSALRKSQLVDLFGLKQDRDTVTAMRRLLMEGVEGLKPPARTPHDSKGWRIYNVLRRRFIDGGTQREVANGLGLGIRQLQREERLACQALAEHLWVTYRLERHFSELASGPPNENTEASTRTHELKWLSDSVQPQLIDLISMIHDIQETIRPILQTSNVVLDFTGSSDVSPVFLKPPPLRQAMLTIITAFIRYAITGRLRLQLAEVDSHVSLLIQIMVPDEESVRRSSDLEESLTIVEELLQLCDVSLDQQERTSTQVTIKLRLPKQQQPIVLVIDDNADTRQLFSRHLTSGGYRFLEAESSKAGLELLRTVTPDAIILDAMMPDEDGWRLLSQLRENPATERIPVVVCTILAQEELAFALGAADFIQKPVRRTNLLKTLERVIDQ